MKKTHHPAHIPAGVRYAVLEDGHRPEGHRPEGRTFYVLRDLAKAFRLPRERKGWGQLVRYAAPEHKARITYAEACEAWPELAEEGHCLHGLLMVSAEEALRLRKAAPQAAPKLAA